MRLCKYDDCRNIRKWDGYCMPHKHHNDEYGRCFPTKSNGKAKDYRGCKTPGCNGVHKANDMCERCYRADMRRKAKELASA